MSRVIVQSVFQPRKDINKTACKQCHITSHLPQKNIFSDQHTIYDIKDNLTRLLPIILQSLFPFQSLVKSSFSKCSLLFTVQHHLGSNQRLHYQPWVIIMRPAHYRTLGATTGQFLFLNSSMTFSSFSQTWCSFVVAFELLEVLKDLEYVCVRAQCFCQTALSRLPVLISGERKLMLINGAYKSD